MGFAKLMSGQMVFKNLNNNLDDREYAIVKTNMWFQMLNDGKKPTKWLKPNDKGTKVNFDFINNSQELYDAGVLELQNYINIVNKEFNLDFILD